LHTEISQSDIDRMINDTYKVVLPAGDKILHVIPQEFIVDNERGIIDPVGMSGVHLEANFHLITGQITASNNILRCVEKCGLRVNDLTLEPIASAIAVLSDEEREAGVALVDMGGGTTDITIFHENIIRHTAVIPLGGNIITKDIKEGCTVMPPQAEKLKVKYGSALATEIFENRLIGIPGLQNKDSKEISERNLALIIQARVEEILDHVLWEIKRSGYERKLLGGIVLTGGGSLLRNIEKLTELHTGMHTRLGLPIGHLAHGYAEEVSSPIYSTAIGLLLKGIDEKSQKETLAATTQANAKSDTITENNVSEEAVQNPDGWFNNIFRKTKEWFEAEPDSNF
ncbi:MAG: cell division protein FtsA, partial [Saprospiraceae bacterium]